MTVINSLADQLRVKVNRERAMRDGAAVKLANYVSAIRHHALVADERIFTELLGDFQEYRSSLVELEEALMRSLHGNRYEEDPSVGEVDCG